MQVEMLSCDHCGVREFMLGDNDDVNEQLEEYKSDGWMYDNTGDYCPSCAKILGKRSLTSQV